MEQLTQNLKDGTMQILEVPYPVLSKGCVLVRNHFSLISAGTEGKTVKDARLGYIGKARARKEEVKKVVDAARTFGVMNTYKMVMNKLDAPSALGYSCAGEVIAVAEDVKEFRVGDFVACGGNTAVHAEVISVPVNLCVFINGADVKHGAFTTLGAVAMQGIRIADLRLGENCVVIGLGLLGQLTLQMLNASGVKTIGVDTEEYPVELAKKNGADLALLRSSEDLEEAIRQFTGGYGTDAVIITAGTDSLDPIDLAGILCRKKGKVVVVGAVPTGFKRTHYFKKELELKMSSSYGPGRYDPEYEEQGIDYPHAYVRWTENRNMQAFVDLILSQKIHLENLITHIYNFNDASKAYDLILGKTENYAGILLRYDTQREVRKSFQRETSIAKPGELNIGLIGAGSFAQNFLLPALKGKGNFTGVVTSKANNARNIADKYGFGFASGDAGELFSNPAINTIFIASRHDSHAGYVLEALKQKKNVFVEKPLCLNESELNLIANEVVKSGAQLMVGFNRRFAPLLVKLKESFTPGIPKAIQIRVNAGAVAADHWTQHPVTGGGRIIGEACHFIDLATFLAGSKIKE
jgi:polar amino acid transport system substrate-binding protein